MRIYVIFTVCFVMLVMLGSTYACSASGTVNSANINTADTADEHETVIGGNALFASESVDDIIKASDAVIIGRVSEILEPKWCDSFSKGQQSICTDVIIDVTRYLYGQPRLDRIAVRNYGGQIGKTKVVSYDMPSFNKGEEVLLLLDRPRELFSDPPTGIIPEGYYWVSSLKLGKYTVSNNNLTDWRRNTLTLADMEQKVSRILGK